MFAAGGGHHFVSFVAGAELTLVEIDNGLLQFPRAGGRRVLGLAGAHRFDGGVFNILRRVKVRLAGAEIDDVNSGCAHRVRRLHRRQRG